MSTWLTVQPSLDPILAPVNAVIAMIDSVLSALIAILNIIQTILNIIKAFLAGLLDPLRAIIEAIIKEIRNIINDLRQMGFYMHPGDIDLINIDNMFADLRGGYAAFERRCVSRLIDRRDPLRPDFSSSSATLGAFFYVSGQDIDALVRVIMAFYNFFKGTKPIRAFAQPADLQVTYGSDSFATFKALGGALEGGVPSKAIIKWTMPGGPGPGAGFKVPAPKGWIIEISTNPGGMKVVSAAPDDANSSSLYPSVLSAVAIDPVTNTPLTVYGGADMVGSASGDYSDVWPPNPADPRAVKLYFQKDVNTPLIPPIAIKDNHYLGRAYFVPNNWITSAVPGQEFMAVFTSDMLPSDADIEQDASAKYGIKLTAKEATSYFVRVRAVSEEVKDALSDTGSQFDPRPMSEETLRLYRFTADNVRQAKSGRLTPSPPSSTITGSDWGISSAPLELTFPNESSINFMQAIEAALIVMILARCDLPPPIDDDEFQVGTVLGTTGMEEVAQKMIPMMGIEQGNGFYGPQLVAEFRKKLRTKAVAMATDLYRRLGPSSALMDVVVEMGETLLGWKWSDSGVRVSGATAPGTTICQSFGIGTEDYGSLTPKAVMVKSDYGVAPGVMSIPCYPRAEALMDGGPIRSPGFGEQTLPDGVPVFWRSGYGSADHQSPVVYEMNTDGSLKFCAFARNLFLANDEVLKSAAGVLMVTAAIRASNDGTWMAWRPLYEKLAPADELLTKIETFLMALLDAMQGVIDQIIRYIEAIQARIYQLQGIIEMIRSLLQQLDFSLPSASGLVVVASGTDGILMDLIASENKPSDDPQSIGCGLILVTGGVPNLLLELLAAVFGGGDVDE